MRYLARCDDEAMVSLSAAVTGALAGNAEALRAVSDLPPEALGAELGSPWYIPPWLLETLVNELLATPKARPRDFGQIRVLNTTRFSTLRALARVLARLENAEDGIFLDRYDVFYEMARIAQRQFPWQRGTISAPTIYRAMLLYGSGTARDHFEREVGIAVSDFMMIGFYLSAAFASNGFVLRTRDLAEIGITPAMREAALARLAILLPEARCRASAIRTNAQHTAYRPSVLRDFPIIAFGANGERLRAPLPELIPYRYTTGLYLDVVDGGSAVWTGIGQRFERYVLEYLGAMMAPYEVAGEREYGPRKTRFRTPDVIVSAANRVLAVVECKAKRMSFRARYADDPVAAASRGFDEIAKGVFQIWRFFAHARLGLVDGPPVVSDCQGILVTADSWLALAAKQSERVMAAAHVLADNAGGIGSQDRRAIAFAQIGDVKYALQHGTGDSFLAACRAIVSDEQRGFLLSVAHQAKQEKPRDYPFVTRLEAMLPWLASPER